MDIARLRDYYQRTQSLLSELQAEGSEIVNITRSNSRYQQLAKLVRLIRTSAEGLTDSEFRSIWQSRGAALHQDLVLLTARRLETENQSGEQFWEKVVNLQYSACDACLEVERERDGMREQLETEKMLREQAESSAAALLEAKEAVEKANLELRTRQVVQQQDIQRRDADARDLVQRLQGTLRERDALRKEKENLAEESSRNLAILERQSKVISQLMEQSEGSVKERDEAMLSLQKIDHDNHVLRVNLGQHSQVIEKLIEVNADMMDAANQYQVLQEELRKRAEANDEKRGVGEVGSEEVETREGVNPESRSHETGIAKQCLLPSDAAATEDEDIPVSDLPISPHSLPDLHRPPRKSSDAFSEPAMSCGGSPSSISGGLLGATPSSVSPHTRTAKLETGQRRHSWGDGASTPGDQAQSQQPDVGDKSVESSRVGDGKRRPIVWSSDALLASQPTAKGRGVEKSSGGGGERLEEVPGPSSESRSTYDVQSMTRGDNGSIDMAGVSQAVRGDVRGESSCGGDHGGRNGNGNGSVREDGVGIGWAVKLTSGTLQGVGGKAKGLLHYVAGADKAQLAQQRLGERESTAL